jgi:NAD(P)-dependent dehydrogenase (short-subunit alcohol dehydrogenase family)
MGEQEWVMVTGSSRRIGKVIALRLAREGYKYQTAKPLSGSVADTSTTDQGNSSTKMQSSTTYP